MNTKIEFKFDSDMIDALFSYRLRKSLKTINTLLVLGFTAWGIYALVSWAYGPYGLLFFISIIWFSSDIYRSYRSYRKWHRLIKDNTHTININDDTVELNDSISAVSFNLSNLLEIHKSKSLWILIFHPDRRGLYIKEGALTKETKEFLESKARK